MSRKGFTMIELILAMGFLATLLITIALIVNMIAGIYQKGLALRAINATGRQLIDEMSRVVGGSTIVPDINPRDGGCDDLPDTNGVIDEHEIACALQRYFVSNDSFNRQLNGVFCTGSYSYIWNTQPSYSKWRDPGERVVSGDTDFDAWLEVADPADNVLQLRHETSPDNWVTVVHKMARVRDADRSACSTVAGSAGNGAIITVSGTPTEMIGDDSDDLALYDLTVFPATQHGITRQTFYSATFILGTMRGGIDILSTGDYCDVEGRDIDVDDGGPTVGLVTDFNYCAVNKFNFAMRATGQTEGEDQYGEIGER